MRHFSDEWAIARAARPVPNPQGCHHHEERQSRVWHAQPPHQTSLRSALRGYKETRERAGSRQVCTKFLNPAQSKAFGICTGVERDIQDNITGCLFFAGHCLGLIQLGTRLSIHTDMELPVKLKLKSWHRYSGEEFLSGSKPSVLSLHLCFVLAGSSSKQVQTRAAPQPNIRWPSPAPRTHHNFARGTKQHTWSLTSDLLLSEVSGEAASRS